ncbi:MAG: sulfite exporter TauE/SafE family protein [Thermomicrobiales bacterium]|nr:sulfite exporter TauE/SafE family protein [Thermomicrobiales bacterium]
MSATDLPLVASLTLSTLLIGIVIGFIGAGGAGVVVALLTSVYHLPIHQAIGTALATMCFVTLAGSFSHLREGNVAPKVGLVVGVAGAVGAVAGARLSLDVPAARLQLLAGLGLWGLAALVWVRTRLAPSLARESAWSGEEPRPPRDWAASVGLGVSGGAAAAFLGVGMAPFIQLGYLAVLRLPLRQTVGTTMLTLVFISATGSLALAQAGSVSAPHLVGATLGLASGAFLGARFTRRAPRDLLRGAVVLVPFLAGAMLLFL